MGGSRKEIVEAGQWIARERSRRQLRGKPLSTSTLARMVNAYIQTQRLPVKQIYQQEISNLENATLDKGPKRLQPWIGVLKQFIESGELDTLIAAANEPVDPPAAVVIDFRQAEAALKNVTVRTPDGKEVGTIVWKARP